MRRDGFHTIRVTATTSETVLGARHVFDDIWLLQTMLELYPADCSPGASCPAISAAYSKRSTSYIPTMKRSTIRPAHCGTRGVGDQYKGQHSAVIPCNVHRRRRSPHRPVEGLNTPTPHSHESDAFPPSGTEPPAFSEMWGSCGQTSAED